MALVHHVLFRFSSQASRGEALRLMEERYSLMEREIPEVLGFTLLEDGQAEGRTAELVLSIRFRGPRELQTYVDHPLHRETQALTRTLVEKVDAFDTEIPDGAD